MTYADIQLDRATAKKLQAVLTAMGNSDLRNNKDVGVQKRRSQRGVPHVLVKVKDATYSVCWFWQRRFYRVFFPFPSDDAPQTRYDFTTPDEVSTFFLEQANRGD